MKKKIIQNLKFRFFEFEKFTKSRKSDIKTAITRKVLIVDPQKWGFS